LIAPALSEIDSGETSSAFAPVPKVICGFELSWIRIVRFWSCFHIFGFLLCLRLRHRCFHKKRPCRRGGLREWSSEGTACPGPPLKRPVKNSEGEKKTRSRNQRQKTNQRADRERGRTGHAGTRSLISPGFAIGAQRSRVPKDAQTRRETSIVASRDKHSGKRLSGSDELISRGEYEWGIFAKAQPRRHEKRCREQRCHSRNRGKKRKNFWTLKFQPNRITISACRKSITGETR